MKKLLRIFTVVFLAFGWLLMSPTEANSDDPIYLASQQIDELKKVVDNLIYKDDLKSLINVAEEKYNAAVYAKNTLSSTTELYNQALSAESVALNDKNSAQSALDQETQTLSIALNNKNAAKDALDIANINLSIAQQNLQTAGSAGVSFEIYPLSRTNNGVAYIADGAGILCQGVISSFNVYAGSPDICGLHDNIIGIFKSTVTTPDTINLVNFAGYTDDGFKLYVDGTLATSQWREQGATWSPYTQWFDTSQDKTLNLEAWWYNGGGPGSMHVGWGYNNIWTGIQSEYLSYGPGPTQQQIDAYNQAVIDQQIAQSVYNDKLYVYNLEVQQVNTLNVDLTNKINTYNTAQSNIQQYLTNMNNAQTIYDQSVSEMNNAINDAWKYYYAQKDREVQAAIAQAAANAASNQPSPEPTITPTPTPQPTTSPTTEPTPEPSVQPTITPEPTTEPTIDPTPTPEPEVTPKPTPEPTIEPSPEPLPEPTPEPTANPEIKDEVLAALIPEKGTGTTEDLSGVIANLTSKDNKLVKLSPEQIAAVSQTLKSLTQEAKAEIAGDLGISSNEVAKIADEMKDNPALASAFVEFNDRAESAGDTPMPFTLADAVTEVQAESFLSDPLGALFNVNPIELLSNFSELGMDMTDDQREKTQEVIIPVVIVSQIASTMIGMRR